MIHSIMVLYNQICVFDVKLDYPFNDWNDEHVQQGFSWRPGSVSFGTMENGVTPVDVQIAKQTMIDASSFRVISVPFQVPDHGKLAIGSIGDEREVEINPESYDLIFELAHKGQNPRCRLIFVPNASPAAKILRADAEITKTSNFEMKAAPAI